MNIFAKFDENSAITQVIKKTKRYGRTHGHTHGRTDVKTVYPTTNKVCGGYSYFYEIRITFIYFVYVSREEVDRLIKW